MTNNKELFMKWIQNLFYIQCVAFIASLIAKLPFIGSWFGWIIRLISIVSIFVIIQLAPVNVRYRKAAIFMGISVVLVFFTKMVPMFVVVGAVFSIIGMYQEYIGHSEVMSGIDGKLSKNWHSLFNWEFFGGFVVAFIAAICAIALSMATASEVAVGVVEAITEGYRIILSAVYLVLLKRMLDVYDKYEPVVEDYF